jgi:hypothetical protein
MPFLHEWSSGSKNISKNFQHTKFLRERKNVQKKVDVACEKEISWKNLEFILKI